MRRLFLPVIAAVLAVCVGVSVRVLTARPDTPLPPPATVGAFVAAGNHLCAPLARLIDGGDDARQLLLARTEAEEIARVPVPAGLRGRDNTLVGALATYVQAFARDLTDHRATGDLAPLRQRVDRLFTGLGLTSCRV